MNHQHYLPRIIDKAVESHLESFGAVCIEGAKCCGKTWTANVHSNSSRTIPHAKGGDIDLLVFSKVLTQEDASRIRHQLWEKIGEQKIDLIIASDTSQPFVRIALKESVKL